MGQTHFSAGPSVISLPFRGNDHGRDFIESNVSNIRLSELHWAISMGESSTAQRLLKQWSYKQPPGSKQLLLDYRGWTTFGVEIRYSQTVLALAVQFHQWDTFRHLIQCQAVLPGVEQRMLVAVSSCSLKRCIRCFGNALELLLWALTQTAYCPNHLTEQDVLNILHLTLRRGVSPQRIPTQLLHKLCRAALLDILGQDYMDLETTTALHRSALGTLKCFVQHGMSLWACNPSLLGSQLSLYHILLCFLTDASRIWKLRTCRKLRQTLCLVLNALYGDGVPLPAISRSSLCNTRSVSAALFWYYYAKVKGRPSAAYNTQEDLTSVLRAHRCLVKLCTRRPPRLAILARNCVRQQVASTLARRPDVQPADFCSVVGQLPMKRRLRQAIEFMDEKYLDDEIGELLVQINCLCSRVRF